MKRNHVIPGASGGITLAESRVGVRSGGVELGTVQNSEGAGLGRLTRDVANLDKVRFFVVERSAPDALR